MTWNPYRLWAPYMSRYRGNTPYAPKWRLGMNPRDYLTLMGPDFPLGPGFVSPDTDVYETPDEVVVELDLPGIERGDIGIKAAKNSITIQAVAKKAEEVEEEDWYQRMRRTRRFFQRVQLPVDVDPQEAKASYKNGTLKIKLPKIETATISIKVE